MTAIDRLQSSLEGHGCRPRRSENHIDSLCPAHDDHHPSLSADQRDDKLLVHCHKGCSFDEVLRALEISSRYLVNGDEPTDSRSRFDINVAYDYRDEHGNLRYQVVRTYPKAFFQRRSIGNGEWESNVRGVTRVPYRLPELLAGVANGERILICEGEKDVDRLVSEGFVATCNSGGAGKFRPEFSQYFHGANVVIVPDNDDVGLAHAQSVAQILQDTSKEIRVVELPDLHEHGDVSDWLDAGGNAARLRTLIESTSIWQFEDNFSDPREGLSAKGKIRKEFEVSSTWDEPIPLPATRDSVKFCPGVFGDSLAAFVRAVATETATRVDLPAIAVLGTVSAVIAGSVVLEARPGWREPMNLYTNVLVAPGEGKSPVMAKVTRPLASIEQERQDRILPEIVETQSRLRIAQTRLKKLERAAADAPPEERLQTQREAVQAAIEVASIDVPAIPRIVTRDATPEALVQLLSEQGGRMAVVTDEGSDFFQMSNRYSTGKGNLSIYIDGWDGKRHASDRVGRESIVIESATLSVCLFGQPIVLTELASDPQMAGRGLLARFLWSLPSTLVGSRPIDGETVPDALTQEWSGLIVNLAREAEATKRKSVVLTLCPGAKNLWDGFRERLEPRLRSDSGDLSSIAESGSKFPGQCLRLAGNLHALRTGHIAGEVDEETMSAAIVVAEYFIDHALKVFAKMKADPGLDDAVLILRWLQERDIYEFSTRDIYKSKEWAAARTRHALGLLVHYGWIRQTDRETGRGRPPQRWERNPYDPGQNPTKLNQDLVMAGPIEADDATSQDRCMSCGEQVLSAASSVEHGLATVCRSCSEADK